MGRTIAIGDIHGGLKALHPAVGAHQHYTRRQDDLPGRLCRRLERFCKRRLLPYRPGQAKYLHFHKGKSRRSRAPMAQNW